MEVFRCAVLFVCVWGASSTSEPRYYPGEENWIEYGHVPSPPSPPSPLPEDICHLPIDSGNCLAGFRFYAFNTTSQKCERFVYGGCGGNDNQFETLKQCQRICEPKDPDIELTELHNTQEQIYPLQNLFQGKSKYCKMAKRTNPCDVKPNAGQCGNSQRRYFFDLKSEECFPFLYNGKGGNNNNFLTKQQCESECRITKCDTPDFCRLPSDVGFGFAAFRPYHFNTSSGACEQFIYGGGHGNKNNFNTRKQCEETCIPKQTSYASKCRDPPNSGYCPDSTQKFYWVKENGTCEPFNFYQCGSNSHLFFTTHNECKFSCHTAVCKLEKNKGSGCIAALPRFYFNTVTQACEGFIYGGCRGNENNFETKDECEKRCLKGQPPSHPKEISQAHKEEPQG